MSQVEDFIARCRRKLVDTSMRSRLLNYRPGSRWGSVEIVDEHPVALWDLLYVREKALLVEGTEEEGVSPAPARALGAEGKEPAAPPAPAAPAPVPAPVPEPPPVKDAFAEGIEGSTAERHHDTFLQTRLPPEELALRLRRLADTARLAQEEQGVDTLFLAAGFLRFFEEDGSDVERRAPLLLIPAALERAGPDAWKVRARDDDPLVNPALVEYLHERGVALPRLPESLDAFQPLEWYREVRKVLASKPKWRVTADCILGVFSFQKFVMHEDLKRNADVLARHDVIARLATRTGTGAGTPVLPDEVAGLVLDRDFAPEDARQVVDADSTQLRALAAVQRGHHLVIEGPPGTGKSQTITNLIAGALAAGKNVLFVAEKQAALNVVYDRLKKAGLGDSCFELHSSKANKSAVLKELGRTLDATISHAPPPAPDAARLRAARQELTAYAEAVHRVVEPLRRSVYAAIGRLSALRDAPAARVPLQVGATTEEQLRATFDLLARLSAAAARVGDPAAHPWRDVPGDFLAGDARDAAKAAVDALVGLLPPLERATAEAAVLGAPPDVTLAESLALDEAADAIEASPGVERAVAEDPTWKTAPADAQDLVKRGRSLKAAEARAKEELAATTVDGELRDAIPVAARWGRNPLAWLTATWRRARRALKAAVRPERWKGTAAAGREVEALRVAALERAALAAEPAGPRRFGERWKGGDSDWDDLERTAAWLVRFRGAADRSRLGPAAVAAVERPGATAQPLRRLAAAARDVALRWRALAGAVGWPQGYGEDAAVPAVAARVRGLAADPAGWREWVGYRAVRDEARAGVAGPVVGEAERGAVAWAALVPAFERRFLEQWLDARVAESDVLRRFRGDAHEETVALFRELDKRMLVDHRGVLAAKLKDQTQARLREAAVQPDLAFLRDQLARQRGHKPVRELLLRAYGAVRAVKPCFLMSPMTVAQCLDPAKHRFDIVVFDEASQMTPEDALGAIARGTQLVVVGDPKQLPPTSFFAVQSGQVEPEAGADGEPTFEDLDSVLELALASGFPGARLRWHYRSRHESLITYSNREFYDSTLFTFPSPDLDRSVLGLQFRHVADGRYEGAGVNRAEAARVVDAVLEHARTRPTKSLCVGTFSLPQQLAVQDELERRRRDEPWLEEFLALDRREPFFVKNLESIQGDERDVVILSITYGPGADGRIRYNFGPINGQNGWRRLNVLTTRARERMIVFSSMRADDIQLPVGASQGSSLLQAFLRYAETGVLDVGPVAAPPIASDSPFEGEVGAALARAGVKLEPQVGVAGYRIDLGVVDPAVAGRFACGIECDGVSYRAAESARDRDRLREEVLQGLGWRLHRVWSVDWWHDAPGQTKRLLDDIERSRAASQGAKSVDAAPGANAESPATAGAAATAASAATGSAPATSAPPAPASAARFEAYRRGSVRPRTKGLGESSDSTVALVMREILQAEGPLHEDDLRLRTLAVFGHARSGARLAERIETGLRLLRSAADVQTDGTSWRHLEKPVQPREREGTGIPPDRIPSWEYDAAVVRVLSAAHALQEAELVAAVRDGFGYGSASAVLRAGVQGSIERLRASGRLGIASGGLALLGAPARR